MMASAHSILNVAENPLASTSRSEEHTSELQSQSNLVCRLLLEKKKNILHTRPPGVDEDPRSGLAIERDADVAEDAEACRDPLVEGVVGRAAACDRDVHKARERP